MRNNQQLEHNQQDYNQREHSQTQLQTIDIQNNIHNNIQYNTQDQIDPNEQEQRTQYMLKLLQMSLQPDSQKLHQSKTELERLSTEPSYITSLMQVINSIHVDQYTTLAALAQLKNYLMKKWFRQNFQASTKALTRVEHPDEDYFLQHFFQLFKDLAQSPLYSKLLLEIAYIVGRQLFPRYTEGLLEGLCQPLEVKVCLKLLLGTAGSFRYMQQREQQHYHNLLQATFPRLFQLLEEYWLALVHVFSEGIPDNDEQPFAKVYEVTYLVFKFGYKTVSMDTPSGCQNRALLAGIAVQVLKADLPEGCARNTQHWKDIQRNSVRFYCLHARKWALKYLQRYIQQAVPVKKRDSFQFSKTTFYQKEGAELLRLLVGMLGKDDFSKMHFHGLLVLEKLAYERGGLFKEQAGLTVELMREVLPKFLVVDAGDREMAVEEPGTFIELQNERMMSKDLSHPRQTALFVWKAILFDHQRKRANQQFIASSLQLVQLWMGSGSVEACEAGLLVLGKLSGYNDCVEDEQFKPAVGLVPGIFRASLEQGNPVLLLRVLGVVDQLRGLAGTELQREVRDWAVAYVIAHHGEKTGWEALLAVRGALALDGIFASPTLCRLELQTVKQLLAALLVMVSAFQMHEIMFSFGHLVERYSKDLVEEAEALIHVMANYALDYNQRDYQQANFAPISAYKENYVQIANISIQVVATFVTQLTQSQPALRPVLEREILKIVENVLAMPECAGDEYLEGVLPLLAHFIDSLPRGEVSGEAWAIFKVLVCRLTGLNKAILQCFRAHSSDPRYAMLLNCTDRKTYGFQQFLVPIRAYLRHIDIANCQIRPLREVHRMPPGANPLELVLYLCVVFFQNLSNFDVYNCGKVFAMLMLIYLQEIHGPSLPLVLQQKVIAIVHAVMNQFNKRPYFTKYALQLFCLWMYALPDGQLLKHINRMGLQNFHKTFRALSISNVHRGLGALKEIPERNRVLMGFGKLLGLVFQIPRAVQPIAGVLVIEMLSMMEENCRDRLLLDEEGEYNVYDLNEDPEVEELLKGIMTEDLSMQPGESEHSGLEQLQQYEKEVYQTEYYRECDEYELDEDHEHVYGSRLDEEAEVGILDLFVKIREQNQDYYQQLLECNQENLERLWNILECMELINDPLYDQLVLGYGGSEYDYEDEDDEEDKMEDNTVTEQHHFQK